MSGPDTGWMGQLHSDLAHWHDLRPGREDSNCTHGLEAENGFNGIGQGNDWLTRQ